MTSRVLSAVNYLLDAFLISLCLVFIDTALALPLAIVWLLLSALTGIVSFIVFMKVDYQLKFAVVIAAIIMSTASIAGASVGIVLIFTMATIYRLHQRFAFSDDEPDMDGNYLFKFVLLFAGALFISLINPSGGKSGLLYAIAIGAVVFYVSFRLLYRYLQARKEGASISQLNFSILSIFGLSAAGGLLVYAMADDVRYLTGSLLGWLIGIVFWPLGVVLEKLVDFLNSLTSEEQKQQNLDKMEISEMADNPTDSVRSSAADFPFELVFIGILLVLFILLILRLRKVKTEPTNKKNESSAVIERSAISTAPVPQTEPGATYGSMDLNIIREAFRDFERAAASVNMERKKHETAREWSRRMGWPTSEAFFETYDFARYGKGEISESKALPFLDEIKKIKEKYLRINV